MAAMETTPELQDPALLAEIDLLCDLIEAAARTGRHLSQEEIDRAMGIGDGTAVAPAESDSRRLSVA